MAVGIILLSFYILISNNIYFCFIFVLFLFLICYYIDMSLHHFFSKNLLSKEQIRLAIEKGDSLAFLYEYQRLDKELLLLAINKKDSEDVLDILVTYQKLSTNVIHVILKKDIKKTHILKALYIYQELCKDQVDIAIKKNLFLVELYLYQKLSSKQMSTLSKLLDI